MDDEVPKHRSSKNTRDWCRGKKGVEHRPKCMKYGDGKRTYLKDWRELVCEVCGKRLKLWTARKRDVKPDWVTF